ncbi:MAG: outer membrane protein assembly factor BamA [Alphaproteobacteria bacterium]
MGVQGLFRGRVSTYGGVVLLWLYLVAGAVAPEPARAQSLMSGGIIREIRVEGVQRIERDTVRSYMRVNPGDPFDPLRLDKSLKNLFSTGLFADVILRRDGDALIVTVVENPIINRIAFEGNDHLDNDALGAEITLRPRVVFTRTKAQSDTLRLLEIYRRSGRYAATVEPKVIQLDQNRVDLVFEINEGPVTTIRSINFIGNRVFSDSKLEDQITTTETAFYLILTSTDTYDPDRLTFDRELLRRFYLKEGYADFRVLSVVAELLPDREGFIVTFTIEEGERQKFGKVDITTTLPRLGPETLHPLVIAKEGEWYNAEEIEETINNLTEVVGNMGYAFVDIRPRVERDRENRLIDVTFEIQEGPKVFVERIDVHGNVRTLDRVIRREFRLVEGDAFNAAKMRRSRQRIRNLGFFKTVNVDTQQGSAPDKTLITVEVEEQSTGDLTFGAGFSTTVGPVANTGIRERNLLGRGQDLRLNFTLSGEQSQLDLSFTEPYFMGRNLAAGFDLYHIVNDDDERSFGETRTGGSLRAGFSYTENLRHIVRYTIENQTIENVDSDASLLVKEEEGEALESTISHELRYDTRDSRFDPREGMVLRLRNELAGLGGDIHYIKSSVGGEYHFPVAEDWTISVDAEVGNIVGLGEDTRISDRHFIGGFNCRGFEFAGVGPRDGPTSDPLGGKNFYTGTLQLDFPLGLPEEFEVRGRVFADVCSAWDLDKTDANVLDEATPRVSIGTGFAYKSPLGPLSMDFGFAIMEEEFDETKLFHFSFGTQF